MLHQARKESAAMDEAVRIARRIEQIKKALARLGDMRPGSLSTQTRSWGGQYAQLSYTHLGKGRTEYVPPARGDVHTQQVLASDWGFPKTAMLETSRYPLRKKLTGGTRLPRHSGTRSC
jgi:hypothetical protein